MPREINLDQQIRRLKKIALESDDPILRTAAIEALSKLGKNAISALIDIAENSEYKNERIKALEKIPESTK